MDAPHITQAVILAGGKGTRLLPLTRRIPKPMIRIGGKPFLAYLIDLFASQGVRDIVMLLGYLPDSIVKYFGDGSKFGVRIRYSMGGVDIETGTRIRQAAAFLAPTFFLAYCDNYAPVNMRQLAAYHRRQKTWGTVTVYTNKESITRNNILVDANGLVTLYDKTRTKKNLNGVDIGFFVLDKKVVSLMPQEDFSFEKTILPRLVGGKQLSAFCTDHRYYSIGSKERLPVTKQFFKPKKVIFLDRDGVINKKAPRADYIKTWSEFIFLPGVLQALRRLGKAGYHIYIVSNQAGIARGIVREEDVKDIHRRMHSALRKHNIYIQGIYYCPHGWDDGCQCRKPKPGMLFQAAHEHYLDLTKSIFIGDDERDMQAGKAAGCKTYLVTPRKSLMYFVQQITHKNL